MAIERINAQIANQLPPAWMSRATASSRQSAAMANSTEIKKMLGEPIPQVVNPKDLPAHIARFFAKGGLLERLRQKLALISKKKGGKFLPAKNTIACVDEDDNVYVGIEFLEKYSDDNDLIAGIMAHEWGHMLSEDQPNIDWQKMTMDQLLEMRRSEEADADGFSGRAMYLMGYDPQHMIDFLNKNDQLRKTKKIPNHKYHNHATRRAILIESYNAQARSMESAKRLFDKKDNTGPKIGRIIGMG